MVQRLAWLFSIAAIAALAAATAAEAKTCADVSISAKGETSRYSWLAKTKARANWRSKVRRTPELGAPYANWAQAESTEERCDSGPSGTLCTFTGTPCRP